VDTGGTGLSVKNGRETNGGLREQARSARSGPASVDRRHRVVICVGRVLALFCIERSLVMTPPDDLQPKNLR